ncbi:DUF2339 domain-containing protein [Lacibacter luteus]|uniref:DUF2339 domain-containing protein n=1 Tax=Lacibacter luteus TaxID=2508719 RepID=A0A4Q1CE40_9BACT|nr:DUF2339 domain-containing protein [Lacibacter luteus]RXK58031.1 DUF2339 domain-containing protein [Lacibacter luteus]
MTDNSKEQLQQLIQQMKALEEQQENGRLELLKLKNELRNFLYNNADNRAAFQPPQPAAKSTFSLEQFIGLKLLNFVGIIVLLIGIAIGVKFAIDKNLISPLLRIVFAYVSGGALLFLSILLRKKYEAFSAILFSGAAATFYFTTYGAFEFYGFIARPVAFSMMVALTVATTWVALKFNRQEIATLAFVGAYGIPFLVGGESGNMAALFSYLFIINSGILFVSFRKDWELLKYLSFSFTWIIFIVWLVAEYSAEVWFGTGLAFTIAFFGLFAVTILGFRILRNQQLLATDYLLTGLLSLFVYISLIALYKTERETTVYADITLFYGLFQFALSIVVYQFLKQYRNLCDWFIFTGIIFLVLFVPIKYSGITISLIWIAGAIALFTAGFFLKKRILRFFSIGLFGITLFKLVVSDSQRFSTIEKIITYVSIGVVLLVISFLYQKYKELLFAKDRKE